MDKRLKRTFLSWHAQGLSADDITTRHNKDPRKDYIVTTMEVADVLREMGAVDPTKRIPQKPEIQPDMPKQFISISESKKQRSKHKMKQKNVTEDQKHWHSLVCGFGQNGKKLLKSPDRRQLERKLQEHIDTGWTQIGGISTDFYCDGETYIAVVQKPKGDQTDAR